VRRRLGHNIGAKSRVIPANAGIQSHGSLGRAIDALTRSRQPAGMSERRYSVYMMARRRNGTLYIGVTNHLAARAHQHRSGRGSEFTSKYSVKLLIWYEHYSDVNDAIAREKQLKKWERRWKLDLIERHNPQWLDLYETLNA
jgi:putative endonuclease